MRRLGWMAIVFAACAVEGSTEADTELSALERETSAAIERVRWAVAEPKIPFGVVASGERAIDAVARGVVDLEADPALSDHQRVKAALVLARAYDDLAQALERPIARPELSAEEQVVLARALEDRARSARAAALGGFEHANAVLCSLGLTEQPSLAEISDGLSRYGAAPLPTGRPCD